MKNLKISDIKILEIGIRNIMKNIEKYQKKYKIYHRSLFKNKVLYFKQIILLKKSFSY
jgi:hypothetical protein